MTGQFSNDAFKITPAGAITQIIDATGDGTGNGLSYPCCAAVDTAGNAFVTGKFSNNAFRITPAGVITEIIDATTKRDASAGSAWMLFCPELGNPKAQVFMRVGDEYMRKHSTADNLQLAFHEAFHGFRRDPKRGGAPWRTENSLVLFRYAAIPTRNFADFCVESRLPFGGQCPPCSAQIDSPHAGQIGCVSPRKIDRHRRH